MSKVHKGRYIGMFLAYGETRLENLMSQYHNNWATRMSEIQLEWFPRLRLRGWDKFG